MLMDDDRLGEAERALRLGQRHAERLGAVANLPAYHFGHGVLGFLSGAWDTAIAEIGAGLLAAADIGSAFGVVWAQSVAALIAVHSDDLVGAAAALTGAEAHLHNEIQPFWHWSLWARAILSEAQGDLAGAAATMATLVDGCIEAGSRYELVELAPDLIRTSLAVGDRQRALRATEAVEQVSGIAQRDNSTAAALRCRGLVAGKPELLVRASNLYVRAGRSISGAVTTSEAAELFAAAGRESDATRLLNEAIAVFEASGAYRHLTRARVLAAGLGGPPRAYTDVHRLTPAQRKVAELVAEGLTSAEIGRRLFISRRTVEGHLARIYTTLGVHSRVELALWLTDQL
jgi:DNA-binding CsgD family transcriptional regulator